MRKNLIDFCKIDGKHHLNKLWYLEPPFSLLVIYSQQQQSYYFLYLLKHRLYRRLKLYWFLYILQKVQHEGSLSIFQYLYAEME